MISLKEIYDALNRRFDIVSLNKRAEYAEHASVSSITVMETVNVDQWVKGGELILTSSSTFPKSNVDLTSLIETLKQKHATCLAIKVIEEDRPSKDELEALTENLEFPILWIPHNVTYLEIMNYVNSMLFNIKEYNDFRERAAYNIIFNNGTIDSLIVDSFKSYDVDITNLDCLVANFNFKADSEDNRINVHFDAFFKTVQLMCSDLINTSKIAEYLFVRQLNSFIIIFLGNREQLQELKLKHYSIEALGQYKENLNVLSVGLSNIEHIKFMPQLLEQAQFTLSFTNHDVEGGYIEAYENVEFYHMIYKGIGSDMDTFLMSTLHTVRKGSILYDTLLMYFRCNENLQETSKQLYIHINTLNYRLKRVQNVTGLNLNVTQNKVKLYLAVIAEYNQ